MPVTWLFVKLEQVNKSLYLDVWYAEAEEE